MRNYSDYFPSLLNWLVSRPDLIADITPQETPFMEAFRKREQGLAGFRISREDLPDLPVVNMTKDGLR